MWTNATLRTAIQARLGDELFLVVSNREPYVHRFEGEDLVCQVPASGLTIALDPVAQACGGTWVAHGSGEADRQVVDAHDRVRVPPERPSYALRRVWLSKEEEDGYYYGFANEGLWPLCHIAYTRPTFNETDWHTYGAVNRKFAEAVLEEVGDRRAFVFIQDYHFALLSRLLKRPTIRTAQFWHIPWPNPEAFRICPWAEELLDGLLGNDLLGFHLLYHCQNFIGSVERMIESKVDYEHSIVTRGGCATVVRPFPISVDFDAITAHAASPEVLAEMKRLKRRHGLRMSLVGLGVDRVDYTKGIVERFQALDRFFERYPEFQGRLVFVEIGVPSRVHIGAYQRLQDEVDQMVERVNWKYQRDGWKPILYLKEHVPPPLLRAWYRLADFCVVSSLHDGMNLVAKEFVASRPDEDGVLLLSRFTGAARELTDAVLINPYATDEMAQAIHQALVMSAEERRRRMGKLRETVRERNIYRWAAQVLSTLFQFQFQEV
jgi:trehalose 6-phosphate synthase